MAKKGQTIALQAEINTEEDWEKLLIKSGLIVVDIYSEWCGPCVAMAPNLKKIKMEIGGDDLHYAVVNPEGIECLSRFRNRSEPTWMFISSKKMVGLMFGCNAPRLLKMITDELAKEKKAQQGNQVSRLQLDFDELTPEEDERMKKEEAAAAEQARIAEAATRKEFTEKRLQQCKYLLENVKNIGIIMFFPHVGNDGMAAVSEEWDTLGVMVFNIGRLQLSENDLNDLLWYEPEPFSDAATEVLLSNQCAVLLLRPSGSEEDFDQDIDQLVLQAAYGLARAPPGDPDCPASKVFRSAEEDGPKIPGMWTPTNALSKAMALEVFFPDICKPHRLPEVEPPPPILAVVFDARKRQEVIDVIKEYPDEILHFGFFTSADPDKATLIAKTVQDYQNIPGAAFSDKLILCVSKKRSDPLLSLALQGPTYVSPDVEDGEQLCATFFPSDYEPEPETEKKDEKKDKKGRTSKSKSVGSEDTASMKSYKSKARPSEAASLRRSARPSNFSGVQFQEGQEVRTAADGGDGASPHPEEYVTAPLEPETIAETLPEVPTAE